jgi:methylated-DNA-[protein]-cysteine S-methyltransferase
MTTATVLLPSPVGPLRIRREDDAVTMIGFADALVTRHGAATADPLLEVACRQLDDYFAGELREFDLPLAPNGTAFQLRVWEQLRRIPYGSTVSYGDIAARLGMPPGASRAVGLANGANPIAIVVPCHRVIGADGTLVGYAGGLHRKRYLLELEAPGVQEALFGV